jgi:arylsulfatase A-like enzyme
MADDLGYESLVCPGNTEVETPNINRLAASGNHDKLAAAYLVK